MIFVFYSRAEYDLDALLPYIVPHKTNPKKLFCNVTHQELVKVYSLISSCLLIDSRNYRKTYSWQALFKNEGSI